MSVCKELRRCKGCHDGDMPHILLTFSAKALKAGFCSARSRACSHIAHLREARHGDTQAGRVSNSCADICRLIETMAVGCGGCFKRHRRLINAA